MGIKARSKIIAVITVLVFILLFGATYGWYLSNFNFESSNITVSTAKLGLIYTDGPEVYLENVFPGSSAIKTFTIENPSSETVIYDIYLENVINTFVNKELVYEISSTNEGGEKGKTIMPSEEGPIIFAASISPGSVQKYTLKITFIETGKNQNANFGAEFSGVIQIKDSNIRFEGEIPRPLVFEVYPPCEFEGTNIIKIENEGYENWYKIDDEWIKYTEPIEVSSNIKIYAKSMIKENESEEVVFDVTSFGDNDGTYICNLVDLNNIRNATSSNYKLMKDIALIEDFIPIPSYSGTFNGNNKTISGLAIDLSTTDLVGFFAKIDASGVVKNLNIKASLVKGRTNVGILSGSNNGNINNVNVVGEVKCTSYCGGLVGSHYSGQIINSWANAHVTSIAEVAGGLIGQATEGSVSLSYSNGSVNAGSYAGGLMGYFHPLYTSAIIEKSYSTSEVISTGANTGGLIGQFHSDAQITSGTISPVIRNCASYGNVKGTSEVGGLIGYTYSNGKTGGYKTSNPYIINNYSLGVVTSSTTTNVGGMMGGFGAAGGVYGKFNQSGNYWISETAKIFTSNIGNPIAVKGAREPLSFSLWDFTNIWNSITEGENATVPFINGITIPEKAYIKNLDFYEYDGDGTVLSPYEIKSEEDLINISGNLTSVFILKNDITLTKPFEPIANFRGILDGDNYKINNLNIEKSTNNIGLFSSIVSEATVKNLKLTDVNVKGASYVGGLVGVNNGTITNVFVSGSINCVSYCGGIAGTHNANNITYSSTYINVTSTSEVAGGLAGQVTEGNMSFNYSEGSVNGGSYVGGLVGYFHPLTSAIIEKSYSTCNVTSMGANAGGLIGRFQPEGGISNGTTSANVRNCAAYGNVAGTSEVGGLIGYTYSIGKPGGYYICSPYVINNYSLGEVSATTTNNVGGVQGGWGVTGGVYGKYNQSGNYWISETALFYTSSIGSPISVKVSNNKSVFTNWDFINIWDVSTENNLTTPYIKDLKIPDKSYFNNLDYYDFEGDGTKDNPYKIKTVEDLLNIKRSVNSNFVLTDNLKLTDEFNPIANFRGSFDGLGNTIDNIYVNQANADNIGGIFKGLEVGSSVKNLKLTNVDVKGQTTIGGLAGYSYGYIENVSIDGSIECRGNYCGGLLGWIKNNTITLSSADVRVNSNADYVGGLVGHVFETNINNSYTTGSISGKNYVGGFVGYINTNVGTYTVNKVYSNMTLNSSGQYSGGITGMIHPYSTSANGTTTAALYNSFSIGDVNGNVDTGGLVGCVYSNGTSSGYKKSVSVVQNNYSVSKVSGSSSIGGLIGRYAASGGVYAILTQSNNYFDIEKSISTGGAFGSGLTTDVMITLPYNGVYNTWDFINTWQAQEIEGYPFLKGLFNPY